MARHVPRIYCPELGEDLFSLPDFQINHIASVFRLKKGDRFIAFNKDFGEWVCEIQSQTSKSITAQKLSLLRTFQETQKLALAFCSIKKDNVKLIIEKGTELGVTDFYPLKSQYTHNDCNIEKLQLNAICASEQSERLDIPVIHDISNLGEFLNNLPNNINWISAIERDAAPSLDSIAMKNINCGFIIGPEGGFSEEEKAQLRALTLPVCLSKNILRAETAAIVCLSVFNSKNI